MLFFVAGVVKTCGSFTELKRPEAAVKTFVRFALAQGAVTYGLELMMALFNIAQGAVSTIMDASGLTAMSDTALPDEMVTIIEDADDIFFSLEDFLGELDDICMFHTLEHEATIYEL